MPIENGRITAPRLIRPPSPTIYKPTSPEERTQERERLDKVASDFRAKLAKSPEERKAERTPEEFKTVPQRFVAVRQPDGQMKLQDLQGKPKLMTAPEIIQQSDAIGSQTQAAISAGKSFRERMKREDEAKFTERYGQKALDTAREEGKRRAAEFTNRLKTDRLRATHGTQGINLSNVSPQLAQQVRDIQAKKESDFEKWDRMEISDPRGTPLTPEQEKSILEPPSRVSNAVGFNVSASKSRTASVLAQSERAAQMAQRSREKGNALYRENVEIYKNKLNSQIDENVIRKGLELLGKGWRWLQNPKGMVPAITDPIAKGTARTFGKTAPKGVLRAGRAAGRLAVGGAIAAGTVGASNWFRGGPTDASPDLAGAAEDRRLTQTVGPDGKRLSPKESRREKRISELRAANAAKRERSAILKATAAQHGGGAEGFKSAKAELNQDPEFQRLTAAATRFSRTPDTFAQREQSRMRREEEASQRAAIRAAPQREAERRAQREREILDPQGEAARTKAKEAARQAARNIEISAEIMNQQDREERIKKAQEKLDKNTMWNNVRDWIPGL